MHVLNTLFQLITKICCILPHNYGYMSLCLIVIMDKRDRVCGINIYSPNILLFIVLRKLFWTDIGAQPVVESASLEGRERTIIASTNLVSPSGLAIDFTEDRLFWCDQHRGLVETAALDGSDRRILLENQVGEACLKRAQANMYRCTGNRKQSSYR